MIINGKDYRVVLSFPVMYSGWDCDSEFHIVEDNNGIKYLAESSHGTFFISRKETLEELICEYTATIDKTIEALNLLKEQ